MAAVIAGRHTPGTFTDQMQTPFSEPRLLILTDPSTEPIKEGALGNIPITAFCNTDSFMRFVNIGILQTTRENTVLDVSSGFLLEWSFRCVEPFFLHTSGMSWQGTQRG